MRFILVLNFNKGIFFLEHRRQRAMKKRYILFVLCTVVVAASSFTSTIIFSFV